MTSHYEIETLVDKDVMRSFAVMQIVVPALDVETWKRLTATEQQRKRWATAKDDKGYIRGLMRMTPMKHPLLGDLLDVPVFATVSLINEGEVSQEMIAFTKRLAEQEGCHAVRIWRSAPATLDVLSVLYEPPEDASWLLYPVGNVLH
ncbi:MAG: hypothetical protein ACK4QP_18675 [Pseudorhizobium sp.]